MRELTYDFFISYSGADIEKAQELYTLLIAQNSKVFISNSMQEGTNWVIELPKAQYASRYTLALISSHFADAYFAQEELVSAIAYERYQPLSHTVIPIYLDGIPEEPDKIPFGIRLKHHFDVKKSGSLRAVVEAIYQFINEEGPIAKVVPEINGHPLLKYPTGPFVEPEDVDFSIIKMYAQLLQHNEFLKVVTEANKYRKAADPGSRTITTIDFTRLPPLSATAIDFWTGAFTQARLNGPRMLAALLSVVPDDLFRKEVRKERAELMKKLETYDVN
jgi:hypothetical protein